MLTWGWSGGVSSVDCRPWADCEVRHVRAEMLAKVNAGA